MRARPCPPPGLMLLRSSFFLSSGSPQLAVAVELDRRHLADIKASARGFGANDEREDDDQQHDDRSAHSEVLQTNVGYS